jgi:hypothetical protein
LSYLTLYALPRVFHLLTRLRGAALRRHNVPSPSASGAGYAALRLL